MNTIDHTPQFDAWLDALTDSDARAAVARRVQRAERGNFGDCKPVGEGVSEMRIDYGPGYRVYYARKGAVVYVLLIGGDKQSQQRDIARAKALWKAIREGQQ